MSHLDEGTLHALLDGELELNEVAEIQAHLGSCSACGLRLREVKEFLGEADRLIASVDLDAPATRPASAGEPVAAAAAHARPEPPPRPAERPRPTEPRPAPREVSPAAWEPWNEQVPVILVPDNESPAERRRRLLQRYGWAAMILILIGAGVMGRLTRPVPMFGPTLAPDTLGRTDSEVVSQEETVRPEQPPAQTPETNRGALALQKSTPAAKPAAKAPARALQPRDEKQAAAARADTVPSERARTVDSAADTAAQATADSIAIANETDSSGAGTEDLATVRQRASEALAQLDREKRRNQAAAATAALDAVKRRRAMQAAAPAAAPTPPAPPTPDQRAQVYLRIGLDEASRQLGGPVHVIEGMSPLFMGLAQGVVVAGADATRPVVRVVYQDAQGRLIFLDQQRLRSGQAAPPASPLSWIQGDMAMWLHGEAGPEILRTYRPRVR